MIKTRFTEMFGIKHPIVRGGMQWVGRAELASAVSECRRARHPHRPLTQPTPDDLRKEIKRCREMTDQPFGVNLTILPTLVPRPTANTSTPSSKSGIKIVETAGNNPQALPAQAPGRRDQGDPQVHPPSATASRPRRWASMRSRWTASNAPAIPARTMCRTSCCAGGGQRHQDPDDRLGRLRRRARPGGGAGAGLRGRQHGHPLHGDQGSADPSEREGEDRLLR